MPQPIRGGLFQFGDMFGLGSRKVGCNGADVTYCRTDSFSNAVFSHGKNLYP
jgi:hypothetical protein